MAENASCTCVAISAFTRKDCPYSCIRDTVFSIRSCISVTKSRISSVASFVCSESCRISSATTANPFPASPALAASIDALSASRLVCPEIPVIVEIILVIFSDFCSRTLTLSCRVLIFSIFAIVALPSFSTTSMFSVNLALANTIVLPISENCPSKRLIFRSKLLSSSSL